MSDISLGSGALVVGGGMFFVVVSISFFTGTEVGLEGFNGLQQIGAQAFTGVITSLANTREITPLVAGVALAAEVGAGFTAQLGAMRISDEIDALEVMGVNSVVYLVATRVWAALITMIPLYLAALFASYLASELVVTKFFGLSTGTYTHYFRLYLPPLDIFYSFLKAMVFAIIVTFVHCYYGYNATGWARRCGCCGRACHPTLHHSRRRRESLHVADSFRRRERHRQVGRMKRLLRIAVSLIVLLGLVFGTVTLVRLANGDYAGDYPVNGVFPQAGEGLDPGSAVVFRESRSVGCPPSRSSTTRRRSPS